MEKKNGIIYDNNGLPTSTNGSWQQTITYLLSAMQITQEEVINYLLSSGNTPTLTIVKTKELPQEVHLELYDPMPIKKEPQVYTKTIVCQKPPVIIKTPSSELYKKCPDFGYPRKREQAGAKERCEARVRFCYTFIKETNGVVTNKDITLGTLKMEKCGLNYFRPYNHYNQPKMELDSYFNPIKR